MSKKFDKYGKRIRTREVMSPSSPTVTTSISEMMDKQMRLLVGENYKKSGEEEEVEDQAEGQEEETNFVSVRIMSNFGHNTSQEYQVNLSDPLWDKRLVEDLAYHNESLIGERMSSSEMEKLLEWDPKPLYTIRNVLNNKVNLDSRTPKEEIESGVWELVKILPPNTPKSVVESVNNVKSNSSSFSSTIGEHLFDYSLVHAGVEPEKLLSEWKDTLYTEVACKMVGEAKKEEDSSSPVPLLPTRDMLHSISNKVMSDVSPSPSSSRANFSFSHYYNTIKGLPLDYHTLHDECVDKCCGGGGEGSSASSNHSCTPHHESVMASIGEALNSSILTWMNAGSDNEEEEDTQIKDQLERHLHNDDILNSSIDNLLRRNKKIEAGLLGKLRQKVKKSFDKTSLGKARRGAKLAYAQAEKEKAEKKLAKKKGVYEKRRDKYNDSASPPPPPPPSDNPPALSPSQDITSKIESDIFKGNKSTTTTTLPPLIPITESIRQQILKRGTLLPPLIPIEEAEHNNIKFSPLSPTLETTTTTKKSNMVKIKNPIGCRVNTATTKQEFAKPVEEETPPPSSSQDTEYMNDVAGAGPTDIPNATQDDSQVNTPGGNTTTNPKALGGIAGVNEPIGASFTSNGIRMSRDVKDVQLLAEKHGAKTSLEFIEHYLQKNPSFNGGVFICSRIFPTSSLNLAKTNQLIYDKKVKSYIFPCGEKINGISCQLDKKIVTVMNADGKSVESTYKLEDAIHHNNNLYLFTN